MAEGLNKVLLLGNLGADPELKVTQGGQAVLKLRLATTESYLDRNNTRQERTEWHNVVIMNDRLADVAERFLKKGSKLYVEGKLQTRKWTDKEGQERYTTEIVGEQMQLLGSRDGGGMGEDTGGASAPRSSQAPSRSGPAGGGASKAPDKGTHGGGLGEMDDDIPF